MANLASQISAVRAAIDLDVASLDRAQAACLARLESNPTYRANLSAKQNASDLTRSIARGDAAGDLTAASRNLGELTQVISDQKLGALAADSLVVAARAKAVADEDTLVELLKEQGVAIVAASTADMNSTGLPAPPSLASTGGSSLGTGGWTGGSTYVHSYVRKDGTFVRGYYRK